MTRRAVVAAEPPVGGARAAGRTARVLVRAVTAYRRLVSPLLPPRCRFAPTCSGYAVEALTAHGAARGSWLVLRRLGRCHPFHPGGHDPVPPARSTTASPSGSPRPWSTIRA